jgi:CTP:molybdopterin cytidylyltransferase MocA
MGGVTGILLAAGAGTRFGGAAPKALAPFRGRPLFTWPLAALRDGGADRVLVVTGAVEIAADDAEVVRCWDWAEGLSASLRAGVAAASGADAVVVALADQPLLHARAVARVLAARAPAEHDAVRATYDGAPNHPTLLESALFEGVARLRGDTGARPLLADPATRVRLVACDGLGSPADADTPAALARMDRVGRRP